MKNIYNILLLMVVTMFSIKASGQNAERDLAALKIGSFIPDISLEKIVNYKFTKAKLSDFRGKYIILDFWATWCGPCVDGLPRLDSLQKKFGDKVVILLVNSEGTTHETYSKIKSFFTKNSAITLPSVVEDNVLDKLFPHRQLPHEVWISPKGKVMSITSDDAVNPQNILKILQSGEAEMQQKSDNMTFDYTKPLYVNGNGGSSGEFIFRSLLTNDIDGTPGFSYFNKAEDGTLKSYYEKGNYLQLYFRTFSMGRNNCIMNVKDVFFEEPNKKYQMSNEEYEAFASSKETKLYFYNLDVPNRTMDSIFFRNYVLSDLNRSLGYSAKIEKRITPCFVVIRKSDFSPSKLTKLKDTTVNVEYSNGHDILKKVYHTQFNKIIDILRTFPNTLPILNESGLTTQLVDIELNIDWAKNNSEALNKSINVNAVRAALNKYGLDLIEANNRAVDVLVLTKSN